MEKQVEKRKWTVTDFDIAKKENRKIVMVTAYDYPTAQVAESGGADVILVGDSLGMVVLGYDSTVPVTMADMIHHAKAVKRGATSTMIVVDLPFLSYQVSIADAVRNAGRLMQEAGADAVKLEGGREMVEVVQALTRAQIPVMGHIGLTPQAVHRLGGFKVQGRDFDSAVRILDDAIALQDAGCFSVVLECVPDTLGLMISDQLSIATIGIGAGLGCDGQVLVMHDLLGITHRYMPKFVKSYARLFPLMTQAVETFGEEVRNEVFPSDEYTFKMKKEVSQQLVQKERE